MGSDWGAVPVRIGPRTGQITAIHLVRREQAPKATAGSPPAIGSGRQAEVHRDTGATVQDASRMSEAHGPEPGHLMARPARRRRQAGRSLGGRADGTGAPGEPPWRSANRCPRRMTKASSAGGWGRLRAGDEGGEHGHILKIRRPGGPARLRQARRRATPPLCRTARGRREGAGCGSAKGQVTGPLYRRPPTEGGGRAVPRIWFEQNEMLAWSRSMSETTRSFRASSSTRYSPPTRSRASTSGLSDGASTG